jgi:DNA polymerase I
MEHDGWLLDLYPAPGKMVAWLKGTDGKAARLEEPWLPSLYVKFRGARERDLDQFDHLIADRAWESRFAEPSDGSASQVLRIRAQAHNLVRLAEAIEERLPYGSYKVYNADVGPAQAYLYERDLFPLARVKAQDSGGRLKWTLLDDVESTNYDTSFLKVMRLKLRSETENKLQRFTEPITGFSLETPGGNGEKVPKVSESETILSIIEEIAREDPDILLTGNGDCFMLPYLGFRARENGLSNRLILGREPRPYSPPRSDGKSYFSYGRILYKAASSRLYGRVHIDEANTFVYSDCGLQGLFEVSRTCRIPLHDAARGSIGKCMSSLQFYHAQKKGILVPWRASRPEHFKDAYDLVVADRGGFIFEPRAGLHENVGEVDFNSLYPNIMLKYNLSGETVLCGCCSTSESRIRVPELDFHVCAKRQGIVPKTLEILLRKRAAYKRLKKESDGALKEVYDTRQGALKWILVCSFGYQGFRNAKFGRIDSHIAVCAFARKVLLDATRIAERNGFTILHGIVDSLWLQKEGTTESDYERLCAEIERETGFKISFEGIYRWVAFLKSRMDGVTPVLNRYYGVFRSGEAKYRGIEARRRDTPLIVTMCQLEIIELLSKAPDLAGARTLMPEALGVFTAYARRIRSGEVPREALLIQKQLSKEARQYTHRIPQAVAAQLLSAAGVELSAGQNLRYLIVNGKAKTAVPEELLSERVPYDPVAYIILLTRSVATLLEPFDYTEADLQQNLRASMNIGANALGL